MPDILNHNIKILIQEVIEFTTQDSTKKAVTIS
jgi:hypothetical protein